MSVKQTAGKILLVLYVLQLDNPVKLERTSVSFSTSGKPKLTTDSWLKTILHSVNKDDAMLYNGFNYLIDKGLIYQGNTSVHLGAISLRGIHITHSGIDIIEGIEQGDEGRKTVKSLFSFNFNNNVTIDSLLKVEVGNIVGIGGAVSGKVGK